MADIKYIPVRGFEHDRRLRSILLEEDESIAEISVTERFPNGDMILRIERQNEPHEWRMVENTLELDIQSCVQREERKAANTPTIIYENHDNEAAVGDLQSALQQGLRSMDILHELRTTLVRELAMIDNGKISQTDQGIEFERCTQFIPEENMIPKIVSDACHAMRPEEKPSFGRLVVKRGPGDYIVELCDEESNHVRTVAVQDHRSVSLSSVLASLLGQQAHEPHRVYQFAAPDQNRSHYEAALRKLDSCRKLLIDRLERDHELLRECARDQRLARLEELIPDTNERDPDHTR
jgi:hypothetical protein